MKRFVIYIDFRCCRIGAEEPVGSECKQPRDRTSRSDTCIVKKSWIDLRAIRILRSGKGLFDGCKLVSRNASIGLTVVASKRARIEIAAHRIEDHAVRHSVLRIALLHQRVYEQFAVAIGEELFDLWLSRRIF